MSFHASPIHGPWLEQRAIYGESDELCSATVVCKKEEVVSEAVRDTGEPRVKLDVSDLEIRYGSHTALSGVTLDVREHEIFGIIGPANAGKTSFLKALNRMDMFNSSMKVRGRIEFDGQDLQKVRNVYGLRSRIGVVFPLPVGLPLSVYDNVALAPRPPPLIKRSRPNAR